MTGIPQVPSTKVRGGSVNVWEDTRVLRSRKCLSSLQLERESYRMNSSGGNTTEVVNISSTGLGWGSGGRVGDTAKTYTCHRCAGVSVDTPSL